MRATWLADAARLTGYPVNEVAGWRGRGHGDFRVIEGVVEHHTADGPTGIYPSLGVVRDGRAGLAGPLANLGLGRDGTIFVIADGVAWHAGASRWAGYTDLNDEFIGIEAESTGTRDDWSAHQRDAYPRLVAAILFYLRRGADRACGHKECATPLGRKIDPAFWDLNAMRGQVAWYLTDPVRRIPRFTAPAPPPAPKELFMALTADEEKTILEAAQSVLFGKPGVRSAGPLALTVYNVQQSLNDLTKKVDDLAAKPAAEVDPAPVVAAVVDAISDAGVAQQVIDALAERLARPAA